MFLGAVLLGSVLLGAVLLGAVLFGGAVLGRIAGDCPAGGLIVARAAISPQPTNAATAKRAEIVFLPVRPITSGRRLCN